MTHRCHEPGCTFSDTDRPGDVPPVRDAVARTREAWREHAAEHPDLTADDGAEFVVLAMLEQLDRRPVARIGRAS